MAIPNLGPKYESGLATNGHIILTRDDDSTDTTPIWMFAGVSVTDNDDGTATLTFEE